MARRRRVDYDGAIHHVMNRGIDHQPIFFGDADRIEFGRLLGECHDDFGVDTLAYCLMDNHYHLVLRTSHANLSAAMRHHAATFVRHTNDRVDRDGPLFRGRFVSIPVDSPRYLRALARYVHLNPLDIPGVRQPADYRWSSYRSYLGFRRIPRFVDLAPVLAMFGNDVDALRRFTERDAGQEERTADLDTLISTVRREITVRRLMDTDACSAIRERIALTVLLDRLPDPLRAQLDRHLAFETDSARRSARSRARQRLSGDHDLNRLVDLVVRETCHLDPGTK